LATLVGTAQLHVIELQTVLKQIVALHPSGGGDAAPLKGWDFRAIAHGELRSPSVTSLLFWHVDPSNQSLDP
jgi:hypothetical protein